MPDDRVVAITDHHPDGQPGTYPNAVCQNEMVGAAATLIAEHWRARDVAIPAALAILLQAAIVSNTLEFHAPACSDRDHQAFEWLARGQPMPQYLALNMREARCSILGLPSRTICARDVKRVSARSGEILVAQVEAPGAMALLQRDDLLRSLRDVTLAAECHLGIINIVDIGVAEVPW